MKVQREGGGADGAAEADRLLVEELKGELSQTKLELETTLKAQHKHLKELDTLRLDTMFVHGHASTTPGVCSRAIDRKCEEREEGNACNKVPRRGPQIAPCIDIWDTVVYLHPLIIW